MGLRLHTLLGVCLLGAVIWHIILLPNVLPTTKVAVFVAPCLWALSVIIRISRLFLFGTLGRISQTDTNDPSIIRIKVSPRRALKIVPESYFVLFIPGTYWINFHSYPLPAFPGNIDPSNIREGAHDVTFILPRAIHRSNMHQLQPNQLLLLDGPLGPGLRFGCYENLFIIAQGTGILSVLSTALHLASRKRHDALNLEKIQKLDEANAELLLREAELAKREQLQHSNPVQLQGVKQEILKAKTQIATEMVSIRNEPLCRDLIRRINIFWVLEHNSQAAWIEAQIKILQDLDPNNVSLVSTFI